MVRMVQKILTIRDPSSYELKEVVLWYNNGEEFWQYHMYIAKADSQ